MIQSSEYTNTPLFWPGLYFWLCCQARNWLVGARAKQSSERASERKEGPPSGQRARAPKFSPPARAEERRSRRRAREAALVAAHTSSLNGPKSNRRACLGRAIKNYLFPSLGEVCSFGRHIPQLIQ